MAYNFRGMANRTHLLQIRVSTTERKEIKTLADAKGLTISAYMRLLAKEKIEAAKSKPK